jgi:hypothetical protein
MQSGRLLAIIGLVAPLTLSSVCAAPGTSGLQIFTSYENSFPGSAGMGAFGLTLGGGIHPYGFIGIGIGACRVSNEHALDPAVKTWSFGAGSQRSGPSRPRGRRR